MKSNQKIVCPFCPLHCDDLLVDFESPASSASASERGDSRQIPTKQLNNGTTSEAARGVNVDCSLARDTLAHSLNPTSPRIDTTHVSLNQVKDHIRSLVEGTVPVVVTTSVTLGAAKNLEQFHRGGRIEWVIQQSTNRAALTRTISRDGMIGATLAEVTRHADLIWIIGNHDQKILPRIDERTGVTAMSAKRMWWPSGVTLRQLGDLLDSIRRDEVPTGASLTELFEAVSNASYFAVIWVDDGFDPFEADVSSALLLELIAALNDPYRHATRRAVLVTFDAGQTGRNVSLWRRNEVSCEDADLAIDDGSTIIRLGESVAATKRASIQIGGRDPGQEFAGVYVPAAVEGIHRADIVIRGDGSVTLPLRPFATSELPTPHEWLSVLLD